ncbi:UvrD-helicase domain-containing protein [Candidatus Saccharibacteria bacterium]|nr:UvrD-helicase domain-containing protein [Candidatus Saccharibacteria bacterium]
MNVKTLQAWFKQHIKDQGRPYTLDKDQAKIVLDCHKNTLVTARAGSGKTRTVVAKVVYLITHEKIPPKNIIIFAFNRKAKTEVNERLAQITFDGRPLFPGIPELATTFHAFAFRLLESENNLVSEEVSDAKILRILEHIIGVPRKTSPERLLKLLTVAKQFIARAEQQFFDDYSVLSAKIGALQPGKTRATLEILEKVMISYHEYLTAEGLINFNQLVARACGEIRAAPYEYIFIDEYQDFSLLFLTLVKALRAACPSARLLAVGDDWQAINRFAGGNVEYFLNFKKYFPEDCARLFIPTNYRSGKKIVKNANYFMSAAISDFNGCKAGNKLKSAIFLGDVSKIQIPLPLRRGKKKERLIFEQYRRAVSLIIEKNPGKSVKILSRNNELSFMGLSEFCESLGKVPGLSFSTIHKSKGLEADVVILLEIDAGKFPGPDKSEGLYEIFGDNERTLLEDEHRLFYVALTRPKEKLYILMKSTYIDKKARKYNFLSYLSEDFLDPLF